MKEERDKKPSEDEQKSKIEEKLERQVIKPKRSKKKIFAMGTGGVIAFILLVLISFFLFSKLSINVGDELNLAIKPFQQSHKVNSGKSANLTFEVTNNNLFQCTSACTFSLYDHRTGKEISSTQEFLKHGQKLEKSFEVSTPIKGEGQSIYTFDAWCHNVKSIICVTDEAGRHSASTALVMYELSDEEKDIRNQKEEFDEYIIESKLASKESVQISKLMNGMPRGIQELDGPKKQLDEVSKLTTVAATKASNIESHWNNEEYLKLKDALTKNDMDELKTARQDLSAINSTLQKVANLRSQATSFLSSQIELADALIPAVAFYEAKDSISNAQKLSKILNASKLIDEQYLILSRNVSHSEEATLNKLTSVNQTFASSIKEYYMMQNQLIYTNLYLSNILKIKEIQPIKSDDLCQDLSLNLDLMETENNAALARQSNLSQNQTINSQDLSEAQDAIMLVASEKAAYEMASMHRTYLDESLKEINVSVNDLLEQNSSIINAVLTNYTIIDLTAQKSIISSYCKQSNYSLKVDDSSFKRLAALSQSNIQILEIDMQAQTPTHIEYILLKEHKAQCCTFGECKACCTDQNCSQENYPVLFIHGHAFNEKNSPETSLGLFSNIQNQLQNEGYVSLAKLELEDDSSSNGEWGLANTKTTMTASYYYITYYKLGDYSVSIRNDESIETYAIRLKELVDATKRKTGKDKIQLVAHSMGGLVAREYILLFGSEDIDTLITVNTPHQGINGRTQSWCTFLGSKKECEEMSEGSIFMNRLASRSLPKDLPAYAIRTTGCTMEGGATGDGVVTNESGILPGAVNIEIPGKCTDALQSNLHNQALDPTKYPKVYEKILEILED